LSIINQTKSLNEMSIFGKVMQALRQAWQNNSSWDNIRGKNLPGSPWGEIRCNGIHLSLEDKTKTKNTPTT
jgi:hypothetical protein